MATMYLIGILAGLLLGFIFCAFIFFGYYGGEMKFVNDEDGVYPYVEGTRPLNEIANKKYVLLKISR